MRSRGDERQNRLFWRTGRLTTLFSAVFRRNRPRFATLAHVGQGAKGWPQTATRPKERATRPRVRRRGEQGLAFLAETSKNRPESRKAQFKGRKMMSMFPKPVCSPKPQSNHPLCGVNAPISGRF